MRGQYRVNEIFSSVQGEGVLVGVPSTFIRLQVCTVGCPWCDSLRTWGTVQDTTNYWYGYVKGSLAGDGWTDGKQRVQWQVTDEDFASAIIEGLKKGYNYTTTVKIHDDWKRHEEDKKTVFGIQCTKQEVVSKILLEDPFHVEAERGFVAGFFDAEGSSNHDYQAVIWQSTPQPLLRIQEFLRHQSFDSLIHGPLSSGMFDLSIPDYERFLKFYQPKIARKWGKYTPVTSDKGGTLMSLEDIFRQVVEFQNEHVVITGGEPTVWNLDPLLGGLHELNLHTQLETSGQNALKGNIKPKWVTWSPKQNLGFEAPMAVKNITNEVKFVIDEHILPSSIQKVVDYMFYERRDPRIHIVLMPEGCPPGEESIRRTMSLIRDGFVDFHKLPVRFGWRLQYTLGVR